MPDALMADGILIIVLLQLLGREGAVAEEGAYGFVVVYEHRGAGENVFPWRRSIERPLLRDALALAVECYADVPAAAVDVNRALAFPVWHGCGHHGVFGHAGVIAAVFLYYRRLRFVCGIHRSNGIVLTENIRGNALLVAPGITECIRRI